MLFVREIHALSQLLPSNCDPGCEIPSRRSFPRTWQVSRGAPKARRLPGGVDVATGRCPQLQPRCLGRVISTSKRVVTYSEPESSTK